MLTNANGLAGMPQWIQLAPTGGPPPGQNSPGHIYDTASNRLTVAFGVAQGTGMATNAVWTLANANGLGGTPQWTNLIPEGAVGSPLSFNGAAAVYDAVDNRMTVIVHDGAPWVLSNANGLDVTPPGWTQLVPSGGPPQGDIQPYGAVYDPATNRATFLFSIGGDNGLQEAWVLTLTAPNLPPIANAGLAQTVHVGSLVTLDGSGSSDPDNNVPLTYDWSFTSKPAGSIASFSNQLAVNPTFTPDIPGDYQIMLIVTDSLGASSSSSITVSTTNTAPVAEAGADQLIISIGTTVQLNGGQSFDVNGDPITYQWSIVSKPSGSAASLTGANTATPTFVADMHGSYVIQVVVSDLWTQSVPDSVTVSFENLKPVANAGISQSVVVGNPVTLDGSGSDANGDPLTYRWALSSVPAGSISAIADPAATMTSFIPDIPGTYVAQLIVNDGFADSIPSTIQVQAVTLQTIAIGAIQYTESLVTLLSPSVFKNTNMKNTLINKLNTVIANIEAGLYADALGQLRNDILGKTDGCANSGSPDKNDWIMNCTAQGMVYPAILDAIAEVGALL